ncbi:hypothetical protein [Natrialba swarupiae]|uniref:hypothetical protein n=1 Tax=Natrialba swarupiae TaxID=2448032 RepID=UPI00192E72A1|nr:hypothetical protein [Natrialba swarupiae]
MTIVDNNVLSALAKIERLSLLPAVLDTIGTPTAVVTELDRADAAGYGFVSRIDTIKAYNDGWLNILSPTASELELANEIRDHALSTTDAQCLAIAAKRDRRLVTDDAHVGTVGSHCDVSIWDLTLVLTAAIRVDAITSENELRTILDALADRDNYRFAASDRAALFAEF